MGSDFFPEPLSIELHAANGCHCERSEAISALKGRDCFVPRITSGVLAMTGETGFSLARN